MLYDHSASEEYLSYPLLVCIKYTLSLRGKVVLKLRGKELWLVTGSIPVPEYLWKLVVDTVSGDSKGVERIF